MKLTVERLPESQVRLDIVAEDAEFSDAMDRAYRKVSRDLQVPGFRKGKAPRGMIERLYGRDIFLEEAHRGLMDSLYRQAIDEGQFVPVGEPSVEITQLEPLAYTVQVPVYPSVEPGDYTAVRVEPVDATIDETAVDEVVDRVRKQNSAWVDPAEPRKPQEGDQVTVDLAITLEDGNPFQEPSNDAKFILGESQLFEPLRAAIQDLNVGETTDVTIAFEEDDEAAAERLRGQAVTYGITLKGVQERELLPLDDDFASKFGGEETMEVFRKRIFEDLHAARTNEARSEVVNDIIAKIAEGATIELPAPMIDDAVEEEVGRVRARLQYQRTTLESYLRATNQSEAEMRAELRPVVSERLRNSLILREIAEREGIEVTDAEVDSEIDDITAGAADPDAIRKIYSADRQMRAMLRNDLYDKRLSDRIIEIATDGRQPVTNGFVPAPSETTGSVETDDAESTRPTETVKSVAGDGSHDCPDEFPVKGNADSGIYHLPGHGAYERTIPEMCFADEDAAVAAGFRAAHASEHASEEQ